MPEKAMLFRPSRHPHQVLFLLTIAAAGVIGVVSPDKNSPTAKQLMGGYGWVFYMAIGVAAVVTLLGIGVRSPNGMLVECMGMLMLGTAFAGYGLAGFAVVGISAALIGAFSLAYAAACLVRSWQIRRDLRIIRLALEAKR